jgi:hypothetical protein
MAGRKTCGPEKAAGLCLGYLRYGVATANVSDFHEFEMSLTLQPILF